MSGGRGEVRWNAATQKWEPVTAAPEATPPTATSPSATPPPAAPLAPPPLPPRPPADAFAPDGYAPGPRTEPPPPSEPGRLRRVPLAVLIAMVVVAVAGAGGGYLLARGGHGGAKAAPTTSASGPALDTPDRTGDGKDSPSPTESSSASPSATVPAGYRLTQDPQGFRLYVPQGWTREDQGSHGVFYNSADHKRLIQVYRVGGAGLRPYDALKATSGELAREHPDYQEISLADDATVPGIAGPVARLVYAYDNQELGHRRQVADYAFLTPDGTQYAVLSAAPTDTWPEQEDTLKTALSVFCAGANCPSSTPH